MMRNFYQVIETLKSRHYVIYVQKGSSYWNHYYLSIWKQDANFSYDSELSPERLCDFLKHSNLLIKLQFLPTLLWTTFVLVSLSLYYDINIGIHVVLFPFVSFLCRFWLEIVVLLFPVILRAIVSVRREREAKRQSLVISMRLK